MVIMPTVCSQVDDELFIELEETAKLEERSISNFIRVAIKERILKVKEHLEKEDG